jgi:Ca2+-binding RTX toxin-like protein
VNNGQPGDPDLDNTVHAAFAGAGATHDASVLTFEVNVTAANVKSISFDIAFGSDEYPEFSSTSFTDIAGVYVNGVDRAFFGNDPTRPLSVLNQNLGYFQNNDYPGGGLPTEYDGISHKLTIFAPVHLGINTVKIAIADTGDSIYDSGIFVSNIQGSSVSAPGLVNTITGNDLPNKLIGGPLDDFIQGLGGNDIINGKGGNDIIDGGPGKDLIIGGPGIDFLLGGPGRDTFEFDHIHDTGKTLATADVISGFQHRIDKINFAKLHDHLTFIGTNPFNGLEPEIRYKLHNAPGTDNDYTLVQVDTNHDKHVDMMIKCLGLIHFTANDFVI